MCSCECVCIYVYVCVFEYINECVRVCKCVHVVIVNVVVCTACC
jgi:hypothetical protein